MTNDTPSSKGDTEGCTCDIFFHEDREHRPGCRFYDPPTPSATTKTDKEKAWRQGKIVWLATWRGRKAHIISGRAVPNWIHEGGNEVKWKVLEGKEWLMK